MFLIGSSVYLTRCCLIRFAAAAVHSRRRRGRRRRPPHRPRPKDDARGRHRWYAAVAAVRRPAGVVRRHGDRDRMIGPSAGVSNVNQRQQLGRRRRPMANIAVFRKRPRLLPPHDARRRRPIRPCAEAGVAFGGVVTTATAPREEVTASTTTCKEREPSRITHRAERARRRHERVAAKRHAAVSAAARPSQRQERQRGAAGSGAVRAARRRPPPERKRPRRRPHAESVSC